jgi:hypothetical protein
MGETAVDVPIHADLQMGGLGGILFHAGEDCREQCVAGSPLWESMIFPRPCVRTEEWAEDWLQAQVAGHGTCTVRFFNTQVRIGWFAGVGPCRGSHLPGGECI